MIPKDARIFVAGHAGLVGSAVLRRLEAAGFTNILTATRPARPARPGGGELLVSANRPEYVFLVAGTVGGILANSTRPAEFIYDNLMIHATVVHAGHLYGVPQAAVPRQLVHLPARVPAADRRGVPADRAARADQRAVRDGQDRRHQAVPGLPHASTAATSSRPCRPTSTARTTTSTSVELARAAGADPQVPRRQARGPRRGRRSGAPARRAASSSTSTTWPTPACS